MMHSSNRSADGFSFLSIAPFLWILVCFSQQTATVRADNAAGKLRPATQNHSRSLYAARHQKRWIRTQQQKSCTESN